MSWHKKSVEQLRIDRNQLFKDGDDVWNEMIRILRDFVGGRMTFNEMSEKLSALKEKVLSIQERLDEYDEYIKSKIRSLTVN